MKKLTFLMLIFSIIGIISAQITNFPHFEGFEETTDNNLPTGWSSITISNGQVLTEYGQTSAPPQEGNRMLILRVFGFSDPGDTFRAIAVTPAIDRYQNVTMSFWTRGAGVYPTQLLLSIGSMTDPTDQNTFNEITQFNITNDYEPHELNLENATGPYIAFSMGWSDFPLLTILLIDSITFEMNATIQPPINLNAVSETGLVTLTWSPPNEGPDPTGYRVYRNGIVVMQDGIFLSFFDSEVTNRRTYYYYVTALLDTEESNPSNTSIATPLESEANILFFDDFEGGQGDWQIDAQLAMINWYWASPYIYPANASGGGGMHIAGTSATWTAGYTVGSYKALTQTYFDLPEVNSNAVDLKLSFDIAIGTVFESHYLSVYLFPLDITIEDVVIQDLDLFTDIIREISIYRIGEEGYNPSLITGISQDDWYYIEIDIQEELIHELDRTRLVFSYITITPDNVYGTAGPGPAIDNVLLTYVIDDFPKPRNLQGTANYNIVNLTWDPPLPSESTLFGYRIQKNGSLLEDILPTTQLEYEDTNVTPETTYLYRIQAVYTNIDGNTALSDPIEITTLAVADKDNIIILETLLVGNYPNPFNPETIISFSLDVETLLRIDIFNIKGQKVNTLINQIYNPGNHTVIWNGKDTNGTDVSSGLYFYQMKTIDYSATKKMMLIK